MKLQRASPSETELATDRRSLMKSACLCLRVSTEHRENQPWRPHIPKPNDCKQARIPLTPIAIATFSLFGEMLSVRMSDVREFGEIRTAAGVLN